MKSFFTAFGFFTVFGVGLVSHLGAAEDSRLEQLSKITKTMAVVEKYYVDDLNFIDISRLFQGFLAILMHTQATLMKEPLKIYKSLLVASLADLALP